MKTELMKLTEKKYCESILNVLIKYDPKEVGYCVDATRYLIKKHLELKEEIVKIKKDEGDVTHCVAVTPDGLIIDTQFLQFKENHNFKFDYCIFTREEHEKFLPRYIFGDE